MTTCTHDLGNNESVSTGYSFYEEQGYLALTLTESKWLKTERGAIVWLARRGYAADGSRLPDRSAEVTAPKMPGWSHAPSCACARCLAAR